jgi:hypothetical protein
MKFLFPLIGLLTLAGCSGRDAKSRPTRADTIPAATDDRPAPIRDEVTEKPGTPVRLPAKAGTWTYEKRVDKTGQTVYKASVVASNVLEFEYPYTGGSIATLTIRRGSENTHVYIDVSKGQFNRSFQEGRARVRFDNKAPVTYLLSAAANGRANIVFFDADQKLINQMKAAKNMTVDVSFYGQGVRRISFRTAGLTWNH